MSARATAAVPEAAALVVLEVPAVAVAATAAAVVATAVAALGVAVRALVVAVLELAVQAPELPVRALAALVRVQVVQALAAVALVPEVAVRALVVPVQVVLALAAARVPEVVPLAVVQVLAEPVLALVVQALEVELAVAQVPAEPVQELAVQAPEVAVLALVAARAPEVVPLAVVQVLAEPVLELAVQAPEVAARAPVVELLAPRVGPPRARAEPERVARPVQERQVWEAAQVGPLRPASAVAPPVPVSLEPAVEAPSAALARRVRSVLLPALPASGLRPAVAHPTGRRMAPPRGRARTQALGAGRGATSRRPIRSSRNPAPTGYVPCTSRAISSKAPRTA
jgi:hypothetical protein